MPASWEIMEARRSRILISTIYPADGKVSMDWASATAKLQHSPDWTVINPSGLPYDSARNLAARVCLDQGYAHLFFLDSDVLAPPDIIYRLLATGRDLVGALYFKRGDNYPPSASTLIYTPEDKASPIKMGPLPKFNYGDIIPVDFLPAGATLISRRCLEDVARNFGHPFEWGMDPGFGPFMGPDGQPLPGFSEDYMFSWRAKQIGYQPFLATGIVCLHEMTGHVGIRGLQAPER